MGYELDAVERRVLGVLVEKGYTTPDQYPLSMNAIVNACNQKSCRDPQMNLDEVHVFDAIDSLRGHGLAIVAHTGGRVDRYRHCVPEMLEIQAREAAILAELLLRGPQTDGELRQRAHRMVSIESLNLAQELIDGLIEKGFVRCLAPGGRKRGVKYAHTLYPANEAPADQDPSETASAPSAPVSSASAAAPAASSDEVRELRELIEALTKRVDALESALGGP